MPRGVYPAAAKTPAGIGAAKGQVKSSKRGMTHAALTQLRRDQHSLTSTAEIRAA